MRTLVTLRRTMLSLAILAPALPGHAESPQELQYIDREVDKVAALFNDGLSGKTRVTRKIVFGHLFGSEQEDAVAFFALGGVGASNTHVEYITIFSGGLGRDFSDGGGPKEKPFHLLVAQPVGMRWARTLDWNTTKLSQGKVVVQGLQWKEEDAGCCPSKPIEITFTVSKDFASVVHPARWPVLEESVADGKAPPEKKEQSPKGKGAAKPK